MPDHFEAVRYVIERLGHILADPPQGAAAVRAGAAGRVTHLFARQMPGNGRRAGFCASPALSTAASRQGEAIVGWSVSKVSIASSNCSVSRVNFSEDRPNSARR